ncbi:GNAT family N-acetyltransferase [Streptomyces genisteinicus]|uniref:GNAT family N-acetyltransferase n=1 Tax=Streptomyces genisteinicus TaxID=2768068 RepID=A0A7H0I0P0_9ACTN|nr:GNAT family N-acetyltransferase [Streptomyces genisteinicus]
MISSGLLDRAGRHIALCPVDDDNWRAVADIAPLDGQRRFAPALAARYLLLSSREGVWNSLAVTADGVVVGHVMWARDEEDGSHWIGGMLVDGPAQGTGVGRAAVRTLMSRLATQDDCRVLRLSYDPDNEPAARLYTSLGFRPTAGSEGDEVVVELSAADAADAADTAASGARGGGRMPRTPVPTTPRDG